MDSPFEDILTAAVPFVLAIDQMDKLCLSEGWFLPDACMKMPAAHMDRLTVRQFRALRDALLRTDAGRERLRQIEEADHA